MDFKEVKITKKKEKVIFQKLYQFMNIQITLLYMKRKWTTCYAGFTLSLRECETRESVDGNTRLGSSRVASALVSHLVKVSLF